MTTGDFVLENCEVEVSQQEPSKEASKEGMSIAGVDIEDGASEVPWEDICRRLKLDARMEFLLQLFQESFAITSSIGALAQIPTFLGDYMVREFDYRKFCIILGHIDEASSDDSALWTEHLSKYLTSDLNAASSLMLRLAMTIAKAHGLEVADWQDINAACSNSIRTLPSCYRLERALPGAISIAREWNHLPQGPEAAIAHGSLNPWACDDNRQAFEETYDFPWSRIVAISRDDGEVSGAVSGRFQVVDLAEIEGITIVTLEAIRIGASPDGFPMKPTCVGDVVMFEIEASLGRLLEKGFCLEGDFYELASKTCFISGVLTISPEWAP